MPLHETKQRVTWDQMVEEAKESGNRSEIHPVRRVKKSPDRRESRWIDHRWAAWDKAWGFSRLNGEPSSSAPWPLLCVAEEIQGPGRKWSELVSYVVVWWNWKLSLGSSLYVRWVFLGSSSTMLQTTSCTRWDALWPITKLWIHNNNIKDVVVVGKRLEMGYSAHTQCLSYSRYY